MAQQKFDAHSAFSAHGELAEQILGYEVRDEQLEMASATWQALQQNRALVVEAGTGVGKTLGYLLPVLTFAKKTLISTGTRHLQDQLFEKDLPIAIQASGYAGKVHVLKGRNNYLCLHRFQDYVGHKRGAVNQQLQEWAAKTRDGDVAKMNVPGDETLKSAITSTEDNCLGVKCPEYDDCHVYKARKRAYQADVVITNHHLFAFDLVMREREGSECLPSFEALVFDEAHRLMGALEQAWSEQGSSAKIQALIRDAKQFTQKKDEEVGKHRAIIGASVNALQAALNETHTQLKELCGNPENNERLPPPENFSAKTEHLKHQLRQLLEILKAEARELPEENPDLENLLMRAEALARIFSDWPSGAVGCCEYLVFRKNSFELHSTPIDFSEELIAARKNYPSRWVYTSATLSVGKTFDYFMQQLGLNTEHVDTLQLDSPFDFKRQSLLYQPPNLPDPNDREYTELLLESVLPLLQQLHGRTFMLFTSLRAMNFAAEWLEPRLDCVLLRQGKDQKHLLLQKFASSEDAILLGSISFWEGVDVVGPALSCVIIDKIPFESHHDLLFKARAQHVEVQGDHPFTRLQLPRAALMLKQGCGRLIRSISDRGLIVVGDPRLHTRSYGSTLLQSIPNMRITNDFSEASKFLETLQ